MLLLQKIMLLLFCTLAVVPLSDAMDGRIQAGIYLSPDHHFRVAIPSMRNSFIKEPVIRERSDSDGDYEVGFSVRSLGEEWKLGTLAWISDDLTVDAFFQHRLRNDYSVDPAPVLLAERHVRRDGKPDIIVRVYGVAQASMLFSKWKSGVEHREMAIVAMAATPERGRLRYAVGQFDMPNRGGFWTLDTEAGRKHLAEDQLDRILEIHSLISLSDDAPATGRYSSRHQLFTVQIPDDTGSYLAATLDTGRDAAYDKVMFHAADFCRWIILGYRVLPLHSLQAVQKDDFKTGLRNISEAVIAGTLQQDATEPEQVSEKLMESANGRALLSLYSDRHTSLLSSLQNQVSSLLGGDDTVQPGAKQAEHSSGPIYTAIIVARDGPRLAYAVSHGTGREQQLRLVQIWLNALNIEKKAGR